MFGLGRIVFDTARWMGDVAERDAAAPAFGSRSAPLSPCTVMMAVGAVIAVTAFVAFPRWVFMTGVTLFLMGLLITVVGAVVDALFTGP